MKTLFRIMTLFLTLFCFAGCDDDFGTVGEIGRASCRERVSSPV